VEYVIRQSPRPRDAAGRARVARFERHLLVIFAPRDCAHLTPAARRACCQQDAVSFTVAGADGWLHLAAALPFLTATSPRCWARGAAPARGDVAGVRGRRPVPVGGVAARPLAGRAALDRGPVGLQRLGEDHDERHAAPRSFGPWPRRPARRGRGPPISGCLFLPVIQCPRGQDRVTRARTGLYCAL